MLHGPIRAKVKKHVCWVSNTRRVAVEVAVEVEVESTKLISKTLFLFVFNLKKSIKSQKCVITHHYNLPLLNSISAVLA